MWAVGLHNSVSKDLYQSGVLCSRVVSLIPNPQVGGLPLLSYPCLLIQYTHSYPPYLQAVSSIHNVRAHQWRTEGGFKPRPPEIPKALKDRAKLNPIVKTVKNC